MRHCLQAYTLEFSRLVREANGNANSLAGQKAEVSSHQAVL